MAGVEPDALEGLPCSRRRNRCRIARTKEHCLVALPTAGEQQEKRTALPLSTNNGRDTRGSQVSQEADRVDMKQSLVEHTATITMLHRIESDIAAGNTGRQRLLPQEGRVSS